MRRRERNLVVAGLMLSIISGLVLAQIQFETMSGYLGTAVHLSSVLVLMYTVVIADVDDGS